MKILDHPSVHMSVVSD